MKLYDMYKYQNVDQATIIGKFTTFSAYKRWLYFKMREKESQR